MPANDMISIAQPFHLLTGTSISASTNSTGFHLASFAGGAFIIVNILSVATQGCVFTLLESDDNSTWVANSSYTFTEPVGAPSTSRVMFVHPNKVGPYVALNVNPDGVAPGGSIIGGGTAAVALRHKGTLPTTTYSFTTGS